MRNLWNNTTIPSSSMSQQFGQPSFDASGMLNDKTILKPNKTIDSSSKMDSQTLKYHEKQAHYNEGSLRFLYSQMISKLGTTDYTNILSKVFQALHKIPIQIERNALGNFNVIRVLAYNGPVLFEQNVPAVNSKSMIPLVSLEVIKRYFPILYQEIVEKSPNSQFLNKSDPLINISPPSINITNYSDSSRFESYIQKNESIVGNPFSDIKAVKVDSRFIKFAEFLIPNFSNINPIYADKLAEISFVEDGMIDQPNAKLDLRVINYLRSRSNFVQIKDESPFGRESTLNQEIHFVFTHLSLKKNFLMVIFSKEHQAYAHELAYFIFMINYLPKMTSSLAMSMKKKTDDYSENRQILSNLNNTSPNLNANDSVANLLLDDLNSLPEKSHLQSKIMSEEVNIDSNIEKLANEHFSGTNSISFDQLNEFILSNGVELSMRVKRTIDKEWEVLFAIGKYNEEPDVNCCFLLKASNRTAAIERAETEFIKAQFPKLLHLFSKETEEFDFGEIDESKMDETPLENPLLTEQCEKYGGKVKICRKLGSLKLKPIQLSTQSLSLTPKDFLKSVVRGNDFPISQNLSSGESTPEGQSFVIDVQIDGKEFYRIEVIASKKSSAQEIAALALLEKELPQIFSEFLGKR